MLAVQYGIAFFRQNIIFGEIRIFPRAKIHNNRNKHAFALTATFFYKGQLNVLDILRRQAVMGNQIHYHVGPG